MASRLQFLRSSVTGQRPAIGTQPVGAGYINMVDRQFGFINGAQTAADLVAVRYFSDACDYAAGDWIAHDGEILVASQAITAGPFNRAQWSAPTGVSEVSPTEPASFETGSLWLDTAQAKNYFKVYDGSAWVSFLQDGANILDLDRLQQIATQTLLGRDSAGVGDVETLTVDQLLGWVLQTAFSLLYVDDGGSMQELPPGASGLFLRSNGAGLAPSWEEPSVDLSDYLKRDGTNSFTGSRLIMAPSGNLVEIDMRPDTPGLTTHYVYGRDSSLNIPAYWRMVVDDSTPGSELGYHEWAVATGGGTSAIALRLSDLGHLSPKLGGGTQDLGGTGDYWRYVYSSALLLHEQSVSNNPAVIGKTGILASNATNAAERGAIWARRNGGELHRLDVPIGTIILAAFNNTPAGFFQCAGSGISTTTYADLFNVLGYTWGGSGGTFNLPNLRGVVLRMLDDGQGRDPGRVFATYQADDIKSHDHFASYSHTLGTNNNIARGGGSQGSSRVFVDTEGGAETRMKNIAIKPYIKY